MNIHSSLDLTCITNTRTAFHSNPHHFYLSLPYNSFVYITYPQQLVYPSLFTTQQSTGLCYRCRVSVCGVSRSCEQSTRSTFLVHSFLLHAYNTRFGQPGNVKVARERFVTDTGWTVQVVTLCPDQNIKVYPSITHAVNDCISRKCDQIIDMITS